MQIALCNDFTLLYKHHFLGVVFSELALALMDELVVVLVRVYL